MTAEVRQRRHQFTPRRKARKRMPPPLKLRTHEIGYAARIGALIKPYEKLVMSELIPMLDVIVSDSKVRLDDPSDLIERIFNDIRVRYVAQVSETVMTRMIGETANSIDTHNQNQFTRQYQTVFSVDPIQAEPWLNQEVTTFVSENASLIRSLPTDALSTIEQIVFRDAKRRLSPQAIALKIFEEFGATRARAKLIARDQVGKFNGRLTEVRQQQAGITKYTWQTSGDGRVRSRANSGGYSDHQALDGEEFEWDKPPVTVFKGKRAGERNHPGQDIQCRCTAIPVLDDLIF